MAAPDPFGPWAPDIDDSERLARYRSLRALCQIFCGPAHPLTAALARAEVDPAAAQAAWEALTTVPSLQRRRVLGSLATLMRNSAPPPTKDRKRG